jgi:uncharacterized protein (DUF1330 family)
MVKCGVLPLPCRNVKSELQFRLCPDEAVVNALLQERPMSTIVPTPQQIRRLIEKGPDGPIVMVNLLKYKANASYGSDRPEAKESLSGLEAYRRYGVVALQHVMGLGGSIVWGGPQKLVVVGDDAANEWDEVVCVRYPSREAFLEMTQNPDYLAAHYHREAGLERTSLLCCGPGMAA